MELPARDDLDQDDSFEAIGADINAARVESGMQISEVAHLLRISKHYLKDIEAGDFGKLPGTTYVSGYLRTYAKVVGLDPKQIVDRYRLLLDSEAAEVRYSFPVDNQRPQRSGAMVASIIVIFAIAGYGGWYMMGKPNLAALTGGDDTEVAANTVREATVLGGKPAAIASADSRLDGDLDVGDVDKFTGAVAARDTDQPADAGGLPQDDTQLAQLDDASGSADAIGQTSSVGDLAVATDQTDDQVQTLSADQTTSLAATDAPVTADTTGGDGQLVSANASQSPDPAQTRSADDAASGDLAALTATGADTPSTTQAVAQDDVGAETQLATNAGSAVSERAAPMAIIDDASPVSGVAYAGQRDPDSEITVRATGTSWVEIIRNDGEEVMTRL
ncbi:MAG: helix-turn-helix domain-containing protein, partial [Alphaproteobacteria bacterium]|nr:helix-turn-helix domain-containing protein [Alphaproteobacteria bacterium]